MLAHTYILAFRKLRQKGEEFETSLGNIARPCLQKKKKLYENCYNYIVSAKQKFQC
jgi:hypothetical protein